MDSYHDQLRDLDNEICDANVETAIGPLPLPTQQTLVWNTAQFAPQPSLNTNLFQWDAKKKITQHAFVSVLLLLQMITVMN